MSILDITGEAEAWQEQALCAQTGYDDVVWFPGKGQPATPGRSICRMCPVEAECLGYALADPSLEGVWGGTSERQRRKLRSLGNVGNARLAEATAEAGGAA